MLLVCSVVPFTLIGLIKVKSGATKQDKSTKRVTQICQSCMINYLRVKKDLVKVWT